MRESVRNYPPRFEALARPTHDETKCILRGTSEIENWIQRSTTALEGLENGSFLDDFKTTPCSYMVFHPQSARKRILKRESLHEITAQRRSVKAAR